MFVPDLQAFSRTWTQCIAKTTSTRRSVLSNICPALEREDSSLQKSIQIGSNWPSQDGVSCFSQVHGGSHVQKKCLHYQLYLKYCALLENWSSTSTIFSSRGTRTWTSSELSPWAWAISRAKTRLSGHVVSGGRDGKLMYWRLSDGLCLQTVEVAEITAGFRRDVAWLVCP